MLVTAANPGIETGGFVGESKSRILADLGEHPAVARFAVIDATLEPDERREHAAAFLREHDLDFPIVLKPDLGHRGSGVQILRDQEALDAALDAAEVTQLVQEYVPGIEFGVFYTRVPGEDRGRIFSITEKKMPVLVGDGESTLEELILADDRAVCLATTYLNANASRIMDVPACGEEIQLVELGTHSRGAIFLDGDRVKTPELEQTIDELAQGFDGFWFGRFDVRVASGEDLRAGRGLRVIELNGVTSESTNIYDPGYGALRAWRTLARQWQLVFEIGAANRATGAPGLDLRRLLKLALAYWRSTPVMPVAS
jgi:hypothetical protein